MTHLPAIQAAKDRSAELRFRLRLRRNRRLIESILPQIFGSWDHDAFTERFREYWDPFPTAEARKYLAVDFWMREALRRYVAFGMDSRGGATRVLDIGSGMGYFLEVCRWHGHGVLGLDLEDEPLYNLAIEFFRLPRVVHRVEPGLPLPSLGQRYDLITAFMACFNLYDDGTSWSSVEWLGFLNEIGKIIAPGGSFVVKFNAEPRSGRLYPADLRNELAKLPNVQSEFFMEYMVLTFADS